MSKSKKEKLRIKNIREYKAGQSPLNNESIKIKGIYSISEIPISVNRLNRNKLRNIYEIVKGKTSEKIEDIIKDFGKRFMSFDFTYNVDITVNNNKIILSAYFFYGRQKTSNLIYLGTISFFDDKEIDVSNTFIYPEDIKDVFLTVHIPYYSADGEYLLEDTIRDKEYRFKNKLPLYSKQINNIFEKIIDLGYLFNKFNIEYKENSHKEDDFDFFEVSLNIYMKKNEYILNFNNYQEISCIKDSNKNLKKDFNQPIEIEEILSMLYENNAFLLKKSLMKEDLLNNTEAALEQYMIMNY